MILKIAIHDSPMFLNSVPRSTIDDEYASANEKDPKILLTTSRNPSAPLTQFVKVRVTVIPALYIYVLNPAVQFHSSNFAIDLKLISK